jgi:hypothetical protein
VFEWVVGTERDFLCRRRLFWLTGTSTFRKKISLPFILVDGDVNLPEKKSLLKNEAVKRWLS